VAKYKRLLVVGRFQPPHEGHVVLVKHALDLAEQVVVVIGSAQESHTLRNPLTAGERFELLDKLLRSRLGADFARIRIVPVMDINMNKVWVQYLRMLLPQFEGVVTRNPLVAELFEDMGLAVEEQPLYDRERCEGTRIRRLALEGGPWRECVPPEIVGDLEVMGFERRLRRLAGEG